MLCVTHHDVTSPHATAAWLNPTNNQDVVSEGSGSAEEFDLDTEESDWEDVEDL